MMRLCEQWLVDVFGYVAALRLHRNLMVQTEAQYVFLHHCVKVLTDSLLKNADMYPSE